MASVGLLITAVSMVLSAAVGGVEKFPDIPWGTPLAEVRREHGLEPAKARDETEERNVERYSYALESLGKAAVNECLFEFTDGRFSGMMLTTRGAENTHALLEYLTGRFGKGSDDGHRFWQWLSAETYVSLDEDSAGDGYVLWYGVKWQGGNGR